MSHDTSTSTRLTAALNYAARGWAVLPLIEKRPLNDNGVHGASRDPAIIEYWFRRWPHAGIGIACGSVVVVDIDDPDAVPELTELRSTTLAASTPREGVHCYFRAEGVRSQVFGWGEVRSTGLYVVAPPGPGRQWLNDLPLAELPEAFAKKIYPDTNGPPSFQSTRNPDARAASLGNAVLRDPTRKTLHWAACRFSEMIEWGYPRERAVKILHMVAPSALGAEAIAQNINDGLGIVSRRIDGLVRTLAAAESGHRNVTLYWVAIELLQLTPRAEELLIESATLNGLIGEDGPLSVQQTIRSALRRMGNQLCRDD